ncbi:biotin carboxylase N-terminal domain-containing protein [Nocardioides sp. QY071]|uniref:acetyl/propionyl/methylcrotonyl-CoA carboxylase subunit alpha n=1 Tax=Nocardioides sp. QY071 TaxID=3044187 RepID=UPI00249A0611|nr:biotin carboxylase N-terminal domain-containing protein [Nocardioides sp. QY071]WGY02260.1 biotin carboxylase N-terminal domain-containing protein [Nocardioides sp. QY071]
MITRILVANRGEIARRVFRTARRLGIETVAVHSDADADLPFVREADAAVRLPGNTPAETYLRGDLVIAAALRAGADAIHPGYGFLSENAGFARQVADAGLVWLGPDPSSIDSMGSKIESKKLMDAAGVPVLGNLTVDTATEADLPLLVKASAGGGGRGMRVVRSLGELAGEVEKASAEAESAFGDGTVFVEPYVERGRHVEVQVVGDRSGNVEVFGTRDCSLQRRHQKVVEEAPAPGLSDAVRTAMHDAARAAAEAVDYVGAGTVEFLYDADTERFFFLEMNTRLQVEHPVSELIHGVDLVELQIAVAEGRPVPAVTEPVGHAIEVRLYAEDPAADYAPQTGRLLELEVEHDDTFALDGFGTRLDTGFETGDEVGTFYDAMLSKVITWAPTREQAARSLARVLERARIHGLVTNRDQLVASLRHPAFLDPAGLATSFYGDHPETLAAGGADDLLPLVGAVALAEHRRLAATVQSRIPAGFRNVVAAPRSTRFGLGAEEVEVLWYGGRDGYRSADRDDVVVVSASPSEVVVDVDGVTRRYAVRVSGDAVLVDGPRGGATLRIVPRFVDPSTQVAAGSLLAPMPGSVVSVSAAVGDVVQEGQTILVMEAMKMQHTIAAPYAGTVTELSATAGQQVEAGVVLAVVEPESSEEDN